MRSLPFLAVAASVSLSVLGQSAPVLDDVAGLEAFANGTLATNAISRIMPPGVDLVFRYDAGPLGFAETFGTNFLAQLAGVARGPVTAFPVEVSESNAEPRLRFYANLHGDVVFTSAPPAGYTATNWIVSTYGQPGPWLTDTNLEAWYAERDPARQRIRLELIATNDLPAYTAWLTNEIASVESGGQTNSLLDLYANDIAFVGTVSTGEMIRLYVHAPTNVPRLDLFASADMLVWTLPATLEHASDPVVFQALETGTSATSIVWKSFAAGHALLDTDSDGIADAREILVTLTDPQAADTDGDGLDDGEEFNRYGSSPTNSSTANDGLGDGWKVANSLDPLQWLDAAATAANGLTLGQLAQIGASTSTPVVDTGFWDQWKNIKCSSTKTWGFQDFSSGTNFYLRSDVEIDATVVVTDEYNLVIADLILGHQTMVAGACGRAVTDYSYRVHEIYDAIEWYEAYVYFTPGDTFQTTDRYNYWYDDFTTYQSDVENWASGLISSSVLSATQRNALGWVAEANAWDIPVAQYLSIPYPTSAMVAEALAKIAAGPSWTSLGWDTQTNVGCPGLNIPYDEWNGDANTRALHYVSAGDTNSIVAKLQYQARTTTYGETGMIYRADIAHVFRAQGTSNDTAIAVSNYCARGVANGFATLTPTNCPPVIAAPAERGSVRIEPITIGLDVGDGSGGEPDGDADDDHDGFASYVPGMRGTNPVIVLDGTNLTPQRVNLIIHAPGIHHVIVSNETVSHWRGISTDTVYPGTDKPDISFDASITGAYTTTSECTPFTVSNSTAILPLYVYDYGASARIRIKLFATETSTVPFVITRNLPPDSDGDGMADVWEKQMMTEWNAQYGTSWPIDPRQIHPTADAEPNDPDGNPGGPLGPHSWTNDAGRGDGWTAMEEYRGCWFNSAPGFGADSGFVRLSPARKELMVEVDRMESKTLDEVVTSNEISSAMALVRTAFLDTAGVRLHYLMDETATTNAPLGVLMSTGEDLRTNYAKMHYASTQTNIFWRDKFVWLLLADVGGTGDEALGISSRDWFGGIIGRTGIDQVCGITGATTTMPYRAQLFAEYGITRATIWGTVAAHELGHCVGCSGDYRALSYEGGIRARYWTNVLSEVVGHLGCGENGAIPPSSLDVYVTDTSSLSPFWGFPVYSSAEVPAIDLLNALNTTTSGRVEAVFFGSGATFHARQYVNPLRGYALGQEIKPLPEGASPIDWSAIYPERTDPGIMSYNQDPERCARRGFISDTTDVHFAKEVGSMAVKLNHSRQR